MHIYCNYSGFENLHLTR